MSPDNQQKLNAQLKSLGFARVFPLPADSPILADEFTVVREVEFMQNSNMIVSLFFRKWQGAEEYYWDRYEAFLPGLVPERRQTFRVHQTIPLSCKRAFNLLAGRAVYAGVENFDGTTCMAWMELDLEAGKPHEDYPFRYYRSPGAFDVERALHMHKIVELDNPVMRDVLIRSLYCGNIHPVTIYIHGIETRMLITAAPRYAAIHLHEMVDELKDA